MSLALTAAPARPVPLPTRARRGALLPDARGRRERGDRHELRALLETPDAT